MKNIDIIVYLYIAMCLQCVLSSSSYKLCQKANQWTHLRNETLCVQLSKSEDKFYIQQTEMQFQHNWKDSYTFFFPRVKLECECTCDVIKSYCTLNTKTKEDNCDLHQTHDSTCSNLEYRGTGACPKSYKVCCQAYFSIGDQSEQSKYQAYQLQLWNQRYRFQGTIESKHKNFTFMWTLPTWIKNVIIDEKTTLILDMTKDVDSPFDLSDHWIYYREETGKFYNNVAINEYDRLDFDKMGWFQKNKYINRMDRIQRRNLENRVNLQLQQCNHNIPQFTWTLNATNYYRDNNLNSQFEGKSFNEVYGDQWSVIQSDFFSGKPTFTLISKESTDTKVKVSQNSDVKILVLKMDQSSQNVSLQLNSIDIGTYEVFLVDNNVDIQFLHTFSIDSPAETPYTLSLTMPKDQTSNSIICVLPMSKKEIELCISLQKVFEESTTNDTEILLISGELNNVTRNDTENLLISELNNVTRNDMDTNDTEKPPLVKRVVIFFEKYQNCLVPMSMVSALNLIILLLYTKIQEKRKDTSSILQHNYSPAKSPGLCPRKQQPSLVEKFHRCFKTKSKQIHQNKDCENQANCEEIPSSTPFIQSSVESTSMESTQDNSNCLSGKEIQVIVDNIDSYFFSRKPDFKDSDGDNFEQGTQMIDKYAHKMLRLLIKEEVNKALNRDARNEMKISHLNYNVNQIVTTKC